MLAWHRAGVGGLGGPASFTLTLPALERTPQSSFPLPHPLAWNPQLGRWALLARRGAAGEVASRELGTSMGQGLGHRLWLSNICPALIRVRKLLGPLPHAPQIGRRERGSGDRKQAGVKGGGRWYSGPLTDASTAQHLKTSPRWPPQPCLVPSSSLLSPTFVLAMSSFQCLQYRSLQEALLVTSSMGLSVSGVLVGNPQGSPSLILLLWWLSGASLDPSARTSETQPTSPCPELGSCEGSAKIHRCM